MNATILEKQPNTGPTKNKIHPQKFALWVGCASIVMMFAGFTSAFVVRRAAGNWLEFDLPNLFFWNTALILLSSVVLHAAFISFKKSKFQQYRGLLVLGSLMAVAFVGMQVLAWNAMDEMGIHLTGNPSGSFVYVISGIHAAHVLGGICALTIALIHAFSLKDLATPKRIHRFDLTVTYWHFVDLLWLYLIGFLLLNS